MLAKEPSQRPPSAGDAVKTLRNLMVAAALVGCGAATDGPAEPAGDSLNASFGGAAAKADGVVPMKVMRAGEELELPLDMREDG